ncbi:U3 small nucleolar ribonucleoprotein protein MPP10-like [Ptychodera flava]|uniref:U3 small nucleolar ribonucleoprotein protein MPP10-like n=1 Tax=Ptychodera flava TaxID=63121 RepID=UPI00396AAA3D
MSEGALCCTIGFTRVNVSVSKMTSPKQTEFGHLHKIYQDFSSSTKVSESFLSTAPKLAQTFTQLTKEIYDYTQRESTDSKGPLTELIVDNFDDEQIWQEIELQNDSCISEMVQNVSKIVTAKGSVALRPQEESEEDDEDEEDIDDDADDDYDDEEEEDDMAEYEEAPDDVEYDGSQDLFPELAKKDKLSELLDSETEDLDLDVLMGKSASKSKPQPQRSNLKRKGPSIVDDKFFKLADMEMFLEAEDAKEEKRRRREEGRDESESDDEDDDDDIDMFEDIPSEDEEEELLMDAEDDDDDDDDDEDFLQSKTARNLKYKDFFDAPQGVKMKSKKRDERKQVLFDVEEEDGDDNNDDDDIDSAEEGDSKQRDEDEEGWGDGEEFDDEEEDEKEESIGGRVQTKDLFAASDSEGEDVSDIIGGKKQTKSSFEKRQEKLRQKIDQLEEANLAEKPWQLMGETSASKRPDNSLLEEHVEFDHTTRPAPVITDETTLTLEEMIKQRIKDEAWDDVARKVKPKEEPFEYRKRMTLDQEKSKMSLGEIYEKEYMKQTKQLNEEEENKEHAVIKKMMDSLFLKLDALSNFHYTPKPAIPEIKIVSNMPSITMEEVAPIAVSDANVLAPEEIKEKTKTGELIGDAEKTSTDKKRERRKKKKNQRIRHKEKERNAKLVEKMKPGLGNKYSKKAALEKLEKQSKSDGRTTIIKDDHHSDKKTLSSSKAFFTKLQDEVSSEIKQIKTKKKQKKGNTVTSSKLKL